MEVSIQEVDCAGLWRGSVVGDGVVERREWLQMVDRLDKVIWECGGVKYVWNVFIGVCVWDGRTDGWTD